MVILSFLPSVGDAVWHGQPMFVWGLVGRPNLDLSENVAVIFAKLSATLLMWSRGILVVDPGRVRWLVL